MALEHRKLHIHCGGLNSFQQTQHLGASSWALNALLFVVWALSSFWAKSIGNGFFVTSLLTQMKTPKAAQPASAYSTQTGEMALCQTS